PDFTSLEVISFATSGLTPSGINLPNYRQTSGQKNVSLANVINANGAKEIFTFLSDEDLVLFTKYRTAAFEVQVGIHELLGEFSRRGGGQCEDGCRSSVLLYSCDMRLNNPSPKGHGTGKLLGEDTPGVFNFDSAKPPISPLTGKPIESWYKPGESWGSVFKAVAASYEDPSSAKWGQAHMQARFGILRTFLTSSLVTITQTADNNLVLSLDRDLIRTKGHAAVTDLLKRLMIYKSTADAAGGTAFYKGLTAVPAEWAGWRDVVVARKQPRKVLVQGNTFLVGGEAVFREYEATEQGFLDSVVERGV
ncbi:peptidase family M49-domain-containing protein, partial [Blyttiomyces helicus]